MDRFDGNGRILMKPPAGYGGHSLEMGNSDMDAENGRRVLRDIKNLVHAPPHPCVGAKRGFPGKSQVDERNPPACILRRPITRSFAATLKSQVCSQKATSGNEENLRPISVPLSVRSMDTSTTLDVDDHKRDSDLNLPMEEEVEAALCEFKEVEMADAVADPLIDIDSNDIDDPLSVVEYVDDIYRFYREIEDTACVSPSYMSSQYDINEKMRAILIDWLIEVHYKFELMDETLFLTVNIIDRFLARLSVIRKKLQLVGVVAMLLACKYEEVSVPVIEDLILISDRAYTRTEVLEMEKMILNTLQFNMSVPTPYVFLRRCLKASGSDKKLELLSFYIIELCLVECEMLKFRPSLLAAAAVYTAQCAIKGFKHWTKTSEVHSHYAEEQLTECSQKMVDFHQKAGSGKLTGVHRKFSTLRFGQAAKFEPALFLLDSGLQ